MAVLPVVDMIREPTAASAPVMGGKKLGTLVRLLAVIIAATQVLAMPVRASRIPLGIKLGQGIYVQEVWRQRTPLFCLTNRTGADQVVQVARWQSRQAPPAVVQSWQLDRDATVCHQTNDLKSGELLEFSLADGPRLGLLRAPGSHPEDDAGKGDAASFRGLNDTCPSRGMWLSQPELWLPAGQRVSVFLHLPPGQDDAQIELPVASPIDLPQLRLTPVESPALSVIQKGDHYLIRPKGSLDQPSPHTLELLLDTPAVSQPSMFLFSARQHLSTGGWQCFVRGLLVKP
jgi:hypothetical protein